MQRRIFGTLVKFVLILGTLAPIPLGIADVQAYLSLNYPLVVGLLGVVWLINAMVVGNEKHPGRFRGAGLKAIYRNAGEATEAIHRRISQARTSVKILDTYFGFFENIQSSLEDTLRNPNCHVQLLVARKNGHLVAARGVIAEEEMNEALELFERRLTQFLERLRTFQVGAEQRLTKKEFDVMFPGPLLIVDDRYVFVGNYLQSDHSAGCHMYEFKVGRWIPPREPRRYIESFDRVFAAVPDGA